MTRRLFSVGWLLVCAGDAAALSYYAHSTAAAGSAKHIALGGAVVAAPDGYAMVFLNPAGLAGLSGAGIDFGSDGNRISNFVPDLNNPQNRSLDTEINYSYAGARYIHSDGWGFGYVAQTPYAVDDSFMDMTTVRKPDLATPPPFANESRVRLSLRSHTAAYGRAFLDKSLGVGVAVNFIEGRESFDFSLAHKNPHISEKTTARTMTADLGLLTRPRSWVQLGATYRMGYRLDFDESLNARLPAGVTWFRDAKVPHRVAFGAAFWLQGRFKLLLQGTRTFRTSDTAVPGSALFAGQSQDAVTVGQNDSSTWHWGSEVIVFKKADICIKAWGGGYLEETGVEGGFTRYHNTAGLQYSPWFFDFSIAVDRAVLYDNFSVGLGVDILALVQRIAKKRGWKLPV